MTPGYSAVSLLAYDLLRFACSSFGAVFWLPAFTTFGMVCALVKWPTAKPVAAGLSTFDKALYISRHSRLCCRGIGGCDVYPIQLSKLP